MSVDKRYAALCQILHAIYRTASSVTNINDFSTGALRIVLNAFSASNVILIIEQPDKKSYQKVSINKNLKAVFKTGKRNILTQVEKRSLDDYTTESNGHTLRHPLIFITTLGLISLTRHASQEPFDELDSIILNAVCEKIAICVKNLQVYDEHHKTVLGAIDIFTECLGLHTSTSKIEMSFFNTMINEFAQELGLGHAQVRALEYAAALHDAGKFQIPQKLLNKRKPLTDKERKMFENHPQKGFELFKGIGALRPVLPVILYHHEKYDGTGYPKGLKGSKIPLEARIMSLMDAFDAMYFGRTYRRKVPLDSCIEELKKNRGTQFDPLLVDLFIAFIKRKHIKIILKNADK